MSRLILCSGPGLQDIVHWIFRTKQPRSECEQEGLHSNRPNALQLGRSNAASADWQRRDGSSTVRDRYLLLQTSTESGEGTHSVISIPFSLVKGTINGISNIGNLSKVWLV